MKGQDRAGIIPLCLKHHTGDEGIHYLGRKTFARKFNMTVEDLEYIAGKLWEKFDRGEYDKKTE